MVYINHYRSGKLVRWGGSRSARGVLTPKQLRAGRIFLGWTRAVLSKQSGVSIEAIRAFEVRRSDPRLTTIGKLRGALERGGLELLDDDGEKGPGLRLRRSEKRMRGS